MLLVEDATCPISSRALRVCVLYLSYTPPAYEYCTRPFFRWVRSQGLGPHATGSSKNASGPVGIPLFGAPGDKPNPSDERESLGGGRPPEARAISSDGTHPNEPCSTRHGRSIAPHQQHRMHRAKKYLRVCVLPAAGTFSNRGKNFLRKNFSSFKACADFASCQRPSGKLTFCIYSFHFIISF